MNKPDLINFLEGRLIPDLIESGRTETAKDFKNAVRIMKADDRKIEALQTQIEALKKGEGK